MIVFLAVVSLIMYGLWWVVSYVDNECTKRGGTLVSPGLCLRAEKIEY